MSFQLFAAAHGLQINQLYPADKVQRCATADKPRSKNGAFFWDGFKGWVSDWAQGGELHWFDNPEAKTWTDADRKAWAQRKQNAMQQQSQRWADAAHRAAGLLQNTELKTHGYLMRKGLPDALGLVDENESLLVPMRNLETNVLQGVQVIRWVTGEEPQDSHWEKKMLPGMRAKGAVFRLGPKRAQETILCEGYATGLSLEIAARQMRLGAAVLVCFSDAGMVQAASMVQGRAYCFADNDASGAGERAAQKTNLPYCMSPTVGQDANDVHAKAGLMAVCQLLMEVRRR